MFEKRAEHILFCAQSSFLTIFGRFSEGFRTVFKLCVARVCGEFCAIGCVFVRFSDHHRTHFGRVSDAFRTIIGRFSWLAVSKFKRLCLCYWSVFLDVGFDVGISAHMI